DDRGRTAPRHRCRGLPHLPGGVGVPPLRDRERHEPRPARPAARAHLAPVPLARAPRGAGLVAPGMRAWRAAGWVAAVLLGSVMLAPFAVMLSTSLMDEFEVFRAPPPLLPAVPRWRNYPEALGALPF